MTDTFEICDPISNNIKVLFFLYFLSVPIAINILKKFKAETQFNYFLAFFIPWFSVIYSVIFKKEITQPISKVIVIFWLFFTD